MKKMKRMRWRWRTRWINSDSFVGKKFVQVESKSENGFLFICNVTTGKMLIMTLHESMRWFMGKRKYSNWNVAPLWHVSLRHVRRGTIFGVRRWNVFWSDVSLCSGTGAPPHVDSTLSASKWSSGSGFASGYTCLRFNIGDLQKQGLAFRCLS